MSDIAIPEEVMQAVYGCLERREHTALWEHFADDFVLVDFADWETFTGLDAVKQYQDEIFRGLPDYHVENALFTSQGSKVAVEWDGVGTHLGEYLGFPATGKTIRWPACSVYTIDLVCRKVKVEAYYYDKSLIVHQLRGERE